MTTPTVTERLRNSKLSAEPYHDPKNSMAAPWCVTEYNGVMSIKHRLASKEEAERFIEEG